MSQDWRTDCLFEHNPVVFGLSPAMERSLDLDRSIVNNPSVGTFSVMNFRHVVRAFFGCISIASCGTHAVAASRQNRCGWLQNPTPANWWLDDKDGIWTLSVMGDSLSRGSTISLT
ncbi:DUF4087 domain-containing protein [Paraburkholderia sp. BL17N1]|uniref:DUF4087 domain-containing protein n=1 Tax=Paraburkholderia sp. BL17N1 TaxID=1938798 RepID=UPI001F544750|nr:DUF4087 domain-containing protein [Paraburkholderia sp. BL17N1]